MTRRAAICPAQDVITTAAVASLSILTARSLGQIQFPLAMIIRNKP
jgi:hypothetical protein